MMIRRTHYRCLCGHLEGEHYECDEPLNDKGERPCGEASHQHCAKCRDCQDFQLDEQHEHDLYEQAQQRKYDEWKDRQMEDDDD